jgi:N-acetyl-alpha-D-glucosaminyl L-malate synthase BshA
MMRIGITCYPTYGGSGALATELALELGRRGHEVHMISYASPFRLRNFAEHVFFHEVDLSGAYPLLEYFPYPLALAVKQHEVALREHLDVLHVHYAVPHATAAFLAREMLQPDHDLKVITTLHGTDITLVGQAKSFFTITKFSIERSDAVTAVSAYLRDETYRAFGCTGCAIDVIPNFVSLEEYHPATDGAGERCRSAFGPAGVKVLMHISNFRPVKRVADVVRAFARVRAELPAVLVFVGDGPDRPAAEEQVAELGLARDVRFLGKVDAVADLLRGADLFLLPSASESFGLAALEALACGVPVIASDAGGLREVVTGDAGALVPVGDVEQMAARALDLLRDPARYKTASRAAVAVASRFSADRIVPMYEDLYRQTLGA